MSFAVTTPDPDLQRAAYFRLQTRSPGRVVYARSFLVRAKGSGKLGNQKGRANEHD